jgi:hypothetical protein
MGFFNIFKKPNKIQDEFFGELTLMEIKNNPANSYFEGKVFFKPINRQIECSIDADFTGPTDEQRAFFKRVESSFEQLILKSKPLIEEEFNNWIDNLEIKDFKNEFKVVGISIPRMETYPSIWDMSFETIHDANHLITINFEDFNVSGILIDG